MNEDKVNKIIGNVLKDISNALWSGVNEQVTTLHLSEILDRISQRLLAHAPSGHDP